VGGATREHEAVLDRLTSGPEAGCSVRRGAAVELIGEGPNPIELLISYGYA
jgi:hypothetical protein